LSDTQAPFAGKLYILAAAVFWSTGGLCIKGLDAYSPWTVLSGRSLVSALFFFVLLRGQARIAPGSGWWPAIGSAAYALVVTTFVLANRMTTAANAIILQYTSLLWIALLGWVLVRETPTRRELAALGMGAVGVVLCMEHGVKLFASRQFSGALAGDLVALFSGLAFAFTTIALRRVHKARASGSMPTRAPAMVCLFWGNLVAGLVGLPALSGQIASPGISGHGLAAGWAVLAWLGVGQLGMGYFCYQQGLKTTRALAASLLSLVEPVLNPILVLLVLHEMPSAGTVAGGALILAALLLTITASPKGEADV